MRIDVPPRATSRPCPGSATGAELVLRQQSRARVQQLQLRAARRPLFEKSFRMIYLDQRGSGRSERPWTKDYKLQTLVEDVEQLRKTLGVDKLAIIGHSFGGTLAFEYAAVTSPISRSPRLSQTKSVTSSGAPDAHRAQPCLLAGSASENSGGTFVSNS